MHHLLTSVRVCAVTLLFCSGLYTALILGFAWLFTPGTANGSLLTRADGTVLGSRLIAQQFQQPKYFWPRPSAVDFNAAAAGGSNKSPTSTDLTGRAQKTVAAHGASSERPLPADLAAASGCGLDPHITEQAALYQVARIAAARVSEQRSPAQIEALVRQLAFAPGGFLTRERVVNVLELNLALDTRP
jgi:potassium-transporting ATPase KdpC subunit